jgi:ankyrin repeat protein
MESNDNELNIPEIFDDEPAIIKEINFGDILMVRYLINKQNINDIDEEGDSLLHIAIDADISIEVKNSIVEILLTSGINPNKQNNKGQTAIMFSVMAKNDKILDKILEYKPDVNIKDENGDTALFFAVREKSISMLEKMIKFANVNIQNKKGRTILHEAFLSESKDMINLIQKYNCNPNIRDNAGLTAEDYR